MKSTLTRVPFSSAAFSPIFRLQNRLRFTLSSSTAVAVSLSNPKSVSVQTPLFLRPPSHSATLGGICRWYHWAKTLSASVGSTFSAFDGGPDCSHLLRELKWLAEDAIEDASPVIHQMQLSCTPRDQWRLLKLRTPLEELYALWKQRIEERRPFQYIVGCEHWGDLVLSVQEGVLIPRPETELIVDLVGEVVSGNEGLSEGLWADIGSGSGAIAIGIGRVLGAQGRVIATDLSPVAVAVGSFNVQRYGLQEKIKVRHGSWFEPLKDVEGKLVGLVSNPPYIPSADIHGLQAEVGKHEPRLALDGGVNGMDGLIHLSNQAALMLRPGGFFSFETNGEEQSSFLVNHMGNESRFHHVKALADFAGIQRFVTGFCC